MTKQQKEALHDTFILMSFTALGFALGLGITFIDKKIQTPAQIKEVKIQTYDTLSNDNAHFSKITIDSVEFIFVKYGNQIDLERLK